MPWPRRPAVGRPPDRRGTGVSARDGAAGRARARPLRGGHPLPLEVPAAGPLRCLRLRREFPSVAPAWMGAWRSGCSTRLHRPPPHRRRQPGHQPPQSQLRAQERLSQGPRRRTGGRPYVLSRRGLQSCSSLGRRLPRKGERGRASPGHATSDGRAGISRRRTRHARTSGPGDRLEEDPHGNAELYYIFPGRGGC